VVAGLAIAVLDAQSEKLFFLRGQQRSLIDLAEVSFEGSLNWVGADASALPRGE